MFNYLRTSVKPLIVSMMVLFFAIVTLAFVAAIGELTNAFDHPLFVSLLDFNILVVQVCSVLMVVLSTISMSNRQY